AGQRLQRTQRPPGVPQQGRRRPPAQRGPRTVARVPGRPRPARRQRGHPGHRQRLHPSGDGAGDGTGRRRAGGRRGGRRVFARDARLAGPSPRDAAPARDRPATADRSGRHRGSLPADARGSRGRDRPRGGPVDRGDRRRPRRHARDGQGADPGGLQQDGRTIAHRPRAHAARDAVLRHRRGARRQAPIAAGAVPASVHRPSVILRCPRRHTAVAPRRHPAESPLFRAFFLNRRWFAWSIAGTGLILFATWYKVELDVAINEWFGDFYNLIQKALGQAHSVTMAEYGEKLFTFGRIAGLYILIAVVLDFFIKHYI